MLYGGIDAHQTYLTRSPSSTSTERSFTGWAGSRAGTRGAPRRPGGISTAGIGRRELLLLAVDRRPPRADRGRIPPGARQVAGSDRHLRHKDRFRGSPNFRSDAGSGNHPRGVPEVPSQREDCRLIRHRDAQDGGRGGSGGAPLRLSAADDCGDRALLEPDPGRGDHAHRAVPQRQRAGLPFGPGLLEYRWEGSPPGAGRGWKPADEGRAGIGHPGSPPVRSGQLPERPPGPEDRGTGQSGRPDRRRPQAHTRHLRDALDRGSLAGFPTAAARTSGGTE